MKRRTKSTGYRQKMWDALAERDWESVAVLAEHVGCAAVSAAAYIRVLATHGYVGTTPRGTLFLARHTGPRAPSVNVNTDGLRDWNLDAGMSADDLRAVVAASGLSLAGWLKAAGMHPSGTTRLRQMMNGQRPVSDEIAAVCKDKPAAG